MSHYVLLLLNTEQYFESFIKKWVDDSRRLFEEGKGKRKRKIFCFVRGELPLCSVVCTDVRLNCFELRYISH
jgi:hypothetical protein